jgi:hypothetical protein
MEAPHMAALVATTDVTAHLGLGNYVIVLVDLVSYMEHVNLPLLKVNRPMRPYIIQMQRLMRLQLKIIGSNLLYDLYHCLVQPIARIPALTSTG